jgi:hypothetical protein
MAKEQPPVLEGTVIEKVDPSESAPISKSDEKSETIQAIVHRELPALQLQVGDKVWREHDGEIQIATVQSVDEGGTSAEFTVDTEGIWKGFSGGIELDDEGNQKGNWHWNTSTPPTERPPAQASEAVDPELLTRHLAMKMHKEGARFQGPGGELVSPTGEVDAAGNFILQVEIDGGTEEKSVAPEEFIRDYLMVSEDVQQPDARPAFGPEKESWNKTSRSDLRQIIDSYNEKISVDQHIKLEDLEKEALANLQEANPLNNKLEIMTQLSEDEASQLQGYLEKLRVAATRKDLGGEDDPEVKEYFENDLKDKRSKLAELTYKRINSPAAAEWMRRPKNKKELQSAQDTYDDALRALGRWELLGVEGDQVQQQAAVLALAEMQQLRIDINDAIEVSHDKKWYDKVVDFEWSRERKFGKKKGQKQRLAFGRVGLAMAAGFGVGVAARAVLPGISTLTGAVAGATTGAVVSGYRAHRDIKTGLNDVATDMEAEMLAENIVDQNANFDEVLRAHLTKEANKSKQERLRRIRGRMGRAAARGALAGAFTGGFIDVAGMAVGDFSSSANAAADTPDYGGKVEVVPDHIEPQELTSPSTEELLQQYAGDNADAALTIENGEGPYQTLQELGIPEEKWDDLFNNDELMQKLVENGDAYSLQDAGVQEHGWGWTGNELSTDSAGDLYDAAGMNTPDAISMAESGLPPTYAELTPGAQEFAMNHSVVTDIPNGMGGEELMRELGVDSDAWYQIEADLKSNAPNDFYTMSDGHIGFSHSGALSAGGVEELLKSLKQHGYTV